MADYNTSMMKPRAIGQHFLIRHHHRQDTVEQLFKRKKTLVRPVAINHVGCVVPDIEAGIKWYSEIMGFGLVAGPFDLKPDGPSGKQTLNVLGQQLKHLRIAHMSTGNGVGFELFEPVDPAFEKKDETIEFWRSGFFHICVTDPDVEDLVARIVASGGRQLSDIWPERPPLKDFRMCYCADPFDNVVEVYSHQYENMQAHKAD